MQISHVRVIKKCGSHLERDHCSLLLLLSLVLLPTCSNPEPDRLSVHVCTRNVSIKCFFLSELSLKLPIRFTTFLEAPPVENRFPPLHAMKRKSSKSSENTGSVLGGPPVSTPCHAMLAREFATHAGHTTAFLPPCELMYASLFGWGETGSLRGRVS